MAGETNIPLEAVLKLAVDQTGREDVTKVLDGFVTKMREGEESVGRTGSLLRDMASHVGQIGDGLKSMTGLLGIAGAGAVAQQYMSVSGAGAGLAMAEGHLTGGASTYGAYAQSLLGVQGATGVPYAQLEEGLRTVAQMAGGSLSPAGAARFGALIAGASLASGMSPQSISSVLGSFMESTGMTSGYGTPQGVADNTSLMAGVTQALSAFPGTQVGSMLPGVAGLYEQQALRAGPGGPREAPAQTAGFVNALAQANPLFRNPNTVLAAIEGGNSYLMGGLTNPNTMFAEKLAGISTSQAIEGGPEALEKLAVSEHERLPGQTFRDWLYSTFPPATAKMMEEVVHHPGLMREAHRRGLEAAVMPNVAGYQNTLTHSMGSQTPEAELSRIGAGVLSDIAGVLNPVYEATGPIGAVAAITGGSALGWWGLKQGAGLLGRAAVGALGGVDIGGALAAGATDGTAAAIPLWALGATEAVAAPRSATSAVQTPQLEALRNIPGAQSAARWLAGAAHTALHGITSGGEWLGHELFGTTTEAEEHAKALHAYEKAHEIAQVPQVIKELEKKFGSDWYGGGNWRADKHYKQIAPEIEAFVGKHLHGAGRQTLDEEIGQLRKYQELGPEGYWQQKFGESVGKFDGAVEKMVHGSGGNKNTAYAGGGSTHYASYDPMSGAVNAAPGAVFAAWLQTKGHGGTGGGATATNASYTQATPNAWDQVLERFSGGEYGPHHGGNALAYVTQLAKEHTGGGAHPHDRAIVAADARKYGIPFDVLWGVYGAESSFGKAASNFGLIGQYPGSGTSGNFSTDARVASEDIKKLLREIAGSLKGIHRHQVRGQRA